MKPLRFVLLAIAALFYAAGLQGALFDILRSPTGVYVLEESKIYRKVIEEIDIRSDKTYVWKTTIQRKIPDIPEHSVDTYVRGRWRSSGATVSFYLKRAIFRPTMKTEILHLKHAQHQGLPKFRAQRH